MKLAIGIGMVFSFVLLLGNKCGAIRFLKKSWQEAKREARE